MATWFTSDWHLGHARIIELSNRPFSSLDHMHDVMVHRHNELVSADDTVFVLGDVVMGNFKENLKLVSRFNGRKVLVAGNHDRVSPAYGHNGSEERQAERRAEFLADYLRHFEVVQPYSMIHTIGDLVVQLSHYPFQAEDERDQRYNELRPVDRGLPLVHGHVHESWKLHPNGRELNVGVDVWDFKPVPAERVRELLIPRHDIVEA